jgi:hypothetical protein
LGKDWGRHFSGDIDERLLLLGASAPEAPAKRNFSKKFVLEPTAGNETLAPQQPSEEERAEAVLV